MGKSPSRHCERDAQRHGAEEGQMALQTGQNDGAGAVMEGVFFGGWGGAALCGCFGLMEGFCVCLCECF